MQSQTSLVATQVHLQQWAEQIRSCQNRPSDMSVKEWCRQNGITKPNYYYRLRRVREACLALAPAAEAPAFVELSAPLPNPLPIKEETSDVAGVLYCPNGIRIELYSSAPAGFLQNLAGALRHV